MVGTKAISNRIQTVVLDLIPDVVYLRATDQEANISADQLDLADRVFVLYNNRPTISGSLGQISGVVVETVPLEISFLRLADFDDNDVDTDDLIDDLVDYARKVFNALSNFEVLAEYTDSYSIDLGDGTTKIYDKTMSGVKLSFDLTMQRGVCEFDEELQSLIDSDNINLIDSDDQILVDP